MLITKNIWDNIEIEKGGEKMEVENLSKYIGGKIKFYRNEKKLTQEELAKKLGTKKATISNYETGYRSPQQDMLFELAKVLEISINDLFPQTSVVENNSIEKIYNQLSPPRQEKVYNFANKELEEQKQEQAKDDKKSVIPIENNKKIAMKYILLLLILMILIKRILIKKYLKLKCF